MKTMQRNNEKSFSCWPLLNFHNTRDFLLKFSQFFKVDLFVVFHASVDIVVSVVWFVWMRKVGEVLIVVKENPAKQDAKLNYCPETLQNSLIVMGLWLTMSVQKPWWGQCWGTRSGRKDSVSTPHCNDPSWPKLTVILVEQRTRKSQSLNNTLKPRNIVVIPVKEGHMEIMAILNQS